MIVCLPWVAYGTHRTLHSLLTVTSQWLPTSFSERQQLEEFKQFFDSGDVLLLTWSGCAPSDPRCDEIRGKLLELNAADERPLFDTFLTYADLAEPLGAPPFELGRLEIAERLRGLLLSRDDSSGAMLISLTADGVRLRDRALMQVRTVTSEVCGLPESELLMAGPPIDGWIVDHEAKRDMDRLTLPSMLVSALLCWWCLKSWPHSTAVLTAALFAEGIVLSLMHVAGIRMSALFIVLPPLVFTLTVSGGIHLANYFRDEHAHTGDPTAAAVNAMSHGWAPCLMAASTTAIGLLSLVFSEITPVFRFGILAAVGVLAGVTLLFLILPGVLERWPGRALEPQQQHVQRRHLATSGPRVVMGAALTAMAVCCLGVFRIESSIKLDSLFGRDSDILRCYSLLEDQFGPLVPAEVLLEFPSSHSTPAGQFWERMRIVQSLDQAIEELPGFGSTLSAATLAPSEGWELVGDPFAGSAADISAPGHIRTSPNSRAPSSDLEQLMAEESRKQLGDLLRSQLATLRLLYVGSDREIWRISTRVPALGDFDYATSLDQLQDHIEQQLQDERAAGVTVQTTFTGIMPMVSRVQQVLLRDLFVSFLTAFGLVACVVSLVLRSLVGGMIAMLPNLFPAVVIFGMMGWLRIPVDIGAMMTASVALGIAVDDTFHFLTWYRRGVDDGHGAVAAVAVAYRRCSRAMVQTTLVCGTGMAVFAFSGFLPTQRFAALIAALLFAALVGDLVFLPALLSVSRRSWFQARSHWNRSH